MPHLQNHQEKIDNFAIVNLVLVSICVDFETWFERVRQRQIPGWSGVTVGRFLANQRFVQALRETGAIGTVPEWLGWVWNYVISAGTASRYARCNALILPRFMFRNRRRSLTMLFKWVPLLQSQRLEPYFSPSVGLGIRTTANVASHAYLYELRGTVTRVSRERAEAPAPENARWSYIDRGYVGGPISLLNHACVTHSSVEAEWDTHIVCTVRPLPPSTPITSPYDDNEMALYGSRGIYCLSCGRPSRIQDQNIE